MMDVVAGLSLLEVTLALAGLLVIDGVVLVGLLIPGDLVVVTAAGSAGAPAVLVTGGFGAAGLVAGHLASFAVGRHYGPALWTSRLGRTVGFERWCRAEQTFRDGGDRTVLLTPFIPVVNTVLPALAGALGVAPRRYVVLIAIADLAWVALWSLVGTTSGLLATALGAADLALLVSGIVSGAALIISVLVLRHSHRTAAPLRCELPGDSATVAIDPGTGPASDPAADARAAATGAIPTARRISAQHHHAHASFAGTASPGQRRAAGDESTAELAVQVDDAGEGVHLVTLAGELTIATSPQLDAVLDRLLADASYEDDDGSDTARDRALRHLVVDLAEVRFLNYHAVITLVALRHRAARHGTSVHLIGAGNRLVRRALRAVGSQHDPGGHHGLPDLRHIQDRAAGPAGSARGGSRDGVYGDGEHR